jgi:peroxiredoxin
MVGMDRAKRCEASKRSIVAAAALLCLALSGPIALPLAAQSPLQDLDARNSSMIGQAAPSWTVEGWVNSQPLDVKQLRGKVVLLRFLDDNPRGAAGLKELYRAHSAQGLAVVGLYTPQPTPAETTLEHVRDFASAQGFDFPIGVDARWDTLNRYWLQQADAELAAATFVIDRQGVIRYIQPDGYFEKNSRNRTLRKEYEKLDTAIENLLKSEEGSAAKPRP